MSSVLYGNDGGSDEKTRRRIDVTDMQTKGVDEFVRRNVGTDRVSLEHRAGRTYLVVER